jgi:hypothetical protein
VVAVASLWRLSVTKEERSSITIVREDLEAMVLLMLTLRGWLGTASSLNTGTALLLLLRLMTPLLM